MALKFGSHVPPSRPVALVTGASRGIGKAITLKLGENGYDLIIISRSSMDDLLAVSAQLVDMGAQCHPYLVDVGNYGQVQELFEKHLQPLGQALDLVVNNAGIALIGLLTEMTPDKWGTLMATNLDGLFHTSKFAVPIMVRQKYGNIINISSIWGQSGASCEVAYSASKGGVNSFTKALAKELAPSGIRVNAIACGAIDTTMNQWHSPEERAAFEAQVSLGRLGTVNDVAELVSFIASKKASYITGQVITIDGGM